MMKRSLPLYQHLGFSGEGENYQIADICEANPGLLFDKFIDTWAKEEDEFREQKPSPDRDASPKAKAGGKHTFLDEAARKGCGCSGKLLGDYHARNLSLLASMSRAAVRDYSNNWRFVSGLGSGHPYEAGFIWHRTLGVPYLSGASVKGMIRAWAEQWDKDTWSTVKRLFGDTDDCGAGALIVFDALPVSPPRLEVDIMNPHYSEYYQDPERNPPADYLSPKPVFFLTVAEGSLFRFAMAPRNPAASSAEDDLESGWRLLSAALEFLGAGAKTAVGYGRFEFDESSTSKAEASIQDLLDKQKEEQELIDITAGMSPFAASFVAASREHNYESDKNAFSRDIDAWMDSIQNEPNSSEVLSLVVGLVRKHFPGLLENPDKTQGKKQKPVFSEHQRKIAHLILELQQGTKT